jgi:hypothetical protein
MWNFEHNWSMQQKTILRLWALQAVAIGWEMELVRFTQKQKMTL